MQAGYPSRAPYEDLRNRFKSCLPEFFDKLAGGPDLRRALESGTPPAQLAASWASGVNSFIVHRSPYLRYPDGR